MKKLLTFVAIVLSLATHSQRIFNSPNDTGASSRGYVPVSRKVNGIPRMFRLRLDSIIGNGSGLIYPYTPKRYPNGYGIWTSLNTDSVLEGTTNLFITSPRVQAIGDIRYPLLSAGYVNPSWITSLPWSKITGTPTTLGTYGITDAYTKTQSDGNYLAITGGILAAGGYLGLPQLATSPPYQTNTIIFYRDSAGGYAFRYSNGFIRAFRAVNPMTANRTIFYPDSTGTVTLKEYTVQYSDSITKYVTPTQFFGGAGFTINGYLINSNPVLTLADLGYDNRFSVMTDDVGFAHLNSPTFTGIVLAPDPAGGDSSQRVPTTAWVKRNTGTGAGGSTVSSVFSRVGAVTAASGDYAAYYYPLSLNPANYLVTADVFIDSSCFQNNWNTVSSPGRLQFVKNGGSGTIAGTYTAPTSTTLDSFGRVTAITAGLAIPSVTGNSGKVLGTDGSALQWVVQSGGSGGTPAGNNGYVQFDYAGGFTASNSFVWDSTSKYLILTTGLAGSTASGGNLTLSSTTHATKGKIYFGSAQTSWFDGTTSGMTLVGGLAAGGISSIQSTTANQLTIGNDNLTTHAVTFNVNGSGNLTITPAASMSIVGSISSVTNISVSSGGSMTLSGSGTGRYIEPTTTIATGTTGAQTINKASGSVNFAAGASSLVVTNSMASTTCILHVTIASNDATAKSATVVKAAGSFTINLNAAATSETRVDWDLINN